jgi:hypothetical protein
MLSTGPKDKGEALMGYAALIAKLCRMAPQSLSNEIIQNEIICRRFMPICRHLNTEQALSVKFLV